MKHIRSAFAVAVCALVPQSPSHCRPQVAADGGVVVEYRPVGVITKMEVVQPLASVWYAQRDEAVYTDKTFTYIANRIRQGQHAVVLSFAWKDQVGRAITPSGTQGFIALRGFRFGRWVYKKDALATARYLEKQVATAVGDEATEAEDQLAPWVWLIARELGRSPTAALPAPHATSYSSNRDSCQVSVRNATAYPLTVYCTGPKALSWTLMPMALGSRDLVIGQYRVYAVSAKPGVIPFSGSWAMESGYDYSSRFYIVTSYAR